MTNTHKSSSNNFTLHAFYRNTGSSEGKIILCMKSNNFLNFFVLFVIPQPSFQSFVCEFCIVNSPIVNPFVNP